MNYSEFLMANLIKEEFPEFKNLEYDRLHELYEKAKEWYDLFSGSRFDNKLMSEYHCIEEFISWRIHKSKEIEKALEKREKEIQYMTDAVDDFITYYSSDEDMRKKMRKCLPDWVDTFDHDYAKRQITDLI